MTASAVRMPAAADQPAGRRRNTTNVRRSTNIDRGGPPRPRDFTRWGPALRIGSAGCHAAHHPAEGPRDQSRSDAVQDLRRDRCRPGGGALVLPRRRCGRDDRRDHLCIRQAGEGDARYGACKRYVSRERLRAMLDHEYGKLQEKLAAKRVTGPQRFVFADHGRDRRPFATGRGDAWLGMRFQTGRRRAVEILLHARLLDRRSRPAAARCARRPPASQRLVAAARFTPRGATAELISTLLWMGSVTLRVEIGVVHAGGGLRRCRQPADQPPSRGATLHRDGPLHPPAADGQPSEGALQAADPGGARAFSPHHQSQVSTSSSEHVRQFLADPDVAGEEPVMLMEMTLKKPDGDRSDARSPRLSGTCEHPHLQPRLARLVSNFGRFFRLADYRSSEHRESRSRHRAGAAHARRHHGRALLRRPQGGVLESFGHMFKSNVKVSRLPAAGRTQRSDAQLDDIECRDHYGAEKAFLTESRTDRAHPAISTQPAISTSGPPPCARRSDQVIPLGRAWLPLRRWHVQSSAMGCSVTGRRARSRSSFMGAQATTREPVRAKVATHDQRRDAVSLLCCVGASLYAGGIHAHTASLAPPYAGAVLVAVLVSVAGAGAAVTAPQPRGPYPTEAWPARASCAGIDVALAADATSMRPSSRGWNDAGAARCSWCTMVPSSRALRAEAGPDSRFSLVDGEDGDAGAGRHPHRAKRLDLRAAPVPAWRARTTRAGRSRSTSCSMTSGLDNADGDRSPTRSHREGSSSARGRSTCSPTPATSAINPPDTSWAYSTGTSMIVAGIVSARWAAAPPGCSPSCTAELFDPIGMRTAVPGFDAAGTFLGGAGCGPRRATGHASGTCTSRDGVWDSRQCCRRAGSTTAGRPRRPEQRRVRRPPLAQPRAQGEQFAPLPGGPTRPSACTLAATAGRWWS